MPKRESSNWALISRVFCPVASSIASATSSRADAADAATTALRRRRWEAGLLLRGSNAGAAAVLLVEGADPRGAAAAAASAGEARTLAARRCMAFFDRKQKKEGKRREWKQKECSALANSRAKRFDANLCFLPRTFSLVALPFVPFSLSLPVAFSFSDPFQTTMFALKSSAASRAAVVAPRRQVRTGRAGVESKSRSVFFFLRWLSLRRLFALCSLFFFPGPALTFS